MKRLAHRSTLKRLYLRAIVYGIWMFLVYLLFIKSQAFFSACDPTPTAQSPAPSPTNFTTIVLPPHKSPEEQLKILLPLFFYSLISFSVFYFMMRYTQFVGTQVVKDFRWAKRLRSHKRFVNFIEGTENRGSLYNLNELMITSNSGGMVY